MSDNIKLVIEIPKEDYEEIRDNAMFAKIISSSIKWSVTSAIVDGKPLSENKGEWIVQPSNKEQGERDFIWWRCSNCGQVIYSESEKDREEFHAFCGRCGKAMR